MAAPQSKTLQSLSGKWTLNKTLSDDYVAVLAVQGVNSITRTLISTCSVHLTITQPSKDHVRMEQNATAAKIPGTTEDYLLDWEWRDTKDGFFGEIQGRSRWVGREEASKLDVYDQSQVRWVEGDSEGVLIQAQGKKDDGSWEAEHLWGFEEIQGERRHTRLTRVKNKDGEELKVRMVYDFEGDA